METETFDVGFTGTRGPTTDFQQKRLLELLLFLKEKGATAFHHGDCMGADAMAHDLAIRAGFEHIVLHPPIDEKYRAYCCQHNGLPAKGITHREHKPYLTRNKDIVMESSVMIACPKGNEIQRSGTWATVRYARQQDRHLYLLFPYRAVTEQDPWDWHPSEPVSTNWDHPLDRK